MTAICWALAVSWSFEPLARPCFIVMIPGGPNLGIAAFGASIQKSDFLRHGPRTGGGTWPDLRDPRGQHIAVVPVSDRHGAEDAHAAWPGRCCPSTRRRYRAIDLQFSWRIWIALVALRWPDGGGFPDEIGISHRKRLSRRIRLSLTGGVSLRRCRVTLRIPRIGVCGNWLPIWRISLRLCPVSHLGE